MLIDELEAAHIAIMGLQEVRWSDSGEIGVGNYHAEMGPTFTGRRKVT